MKKDQLPQDQPLRETAVMQSVMANEFRIGNLIKYNGSHNEFGIITQISRNFISGLDFVKLNSRVNKRYFMHEIKPVLLTHEVLLKFGKLEDDCIIQISKKGDVVDIYYNTESRQLTFEVFSDLKEEYSTINLKPKSVHELQNLYFSLTGRELTVA